MLKMSWSEDYKTKSDAIDRKNELIAKGYRAYIMEWGTFDGLMWTVYINK